MRIQDVVLSAGITGFFVDDQQAIKEHATSNGFVYQGTPIADGFKNIREVGESVSVMLVLEDGQIAYGDCITVQYPNVGGRDNIIRAEALIDIIKQHVAPRLIGKEVINFRHLAEEIDGLVIDGKYLHTAIRYGVTQAILDAVAKANKITMAEVIRREYKVINGGLRVKIFSQSGDNRYDNVDKMILKKVDVLPHGLINNVKDKLGYDGELLKEYIQWVRDRIIELRDSEEYSPIIQIDVYGTIGTAFNYDVKKIVDYLGELERVSHPFQLRIEGPVDMGDRETQISTLLELKSQLKEHRILVEIVADEWCNTLEDIKIFADKKAADIIQIKTPDLGGVNNTIEAILYCKANGVGAYSGGSCNETEISSKVSVNIALACGADQCLAKPGMGVDEGYMIVFNEMQRLLALNKTHKSFIS